MKYLRTFENNDFTQEPIGGTNKRETITLDFNRSDLREFFQDEEEINGFEFIKKSIWDCDIESGYVQYKVIIKRISDGKFFECTFQDTVDEYFLFPDSRQVFPYQKTITDFQ